MLELTAFQEKIITLILGTPKPGKNFARSAIQHIQKAWEIREIDTGMAAFRALIAEEEAATAVFHSIKRWNYKGAKLLQPKSHLHKLALAPFLTALASAFAPLNILNIEVILDESVKQPRLKLRLIMPGAGSERFAFVSEPPLHWLIEENGTMHDFQVHFDEIAKAHNVADINKYIERIANIRNKILYASNEGVP